MSLKEKDYGENADAAQLDVLETYLNIAETCEHKATQITFIDSKANLERRGDE
jgi:hypothetical protein